VAAILNPKKRDLPEQEIENNLFVFFSVKIPKLDRHPEKQLW